MKCSASVMVVDDEAMNSAILKRRLDRKGFNVEAATNGQEALDAVVADPFPDLILMDLMMPVMDGWEATKRIKEQFPLVKVIAVSAKADEEYSYKEKGFDDFCKKPIEWEFLMKKICKALS